MAKKSCKKGYYYCYASKKCKKIPMGYYIGGGGWLRKEEEKSEDTEGKKKNGNGANGDGSGNGDSSGGSNGGGVSEGWSAKYKRSIDCNNPKGFSQRAHCQGRKKMNEATMSPAQKRKDTMLKKKYDKSDMKQNMIDQYGKEEGTKIYFATIRKQAMKEEKKGDHEISMAQSQLKKSERNIKKLRKALGTKERNIPAWVQAKITDTEHNTDAAAGYMEEGKRDGKSAKDKDYSLHDWFAGGGWVQTGGKYDGKPCAKQPGQKTKPYCRDADDRASMSKKERSRRAAKKRREDPNPNRTGKAKMVTASYSNWRADLEQLDEIAPALAAGAALGIGAGGMYIMNKLRQQKKKSDQGQGDGNLVDKLNQRKKMLQQLGNSFTPEGEVVSEKKDACYHKVKSRYSVWPSAYASGALVKCRKVGAKNWGNKTKKESYEFSNWRDDFQPTEYESIDIIKTEPLQPTKGIGSDMLGEAKKCWKGYKKAGTQKLFGKTYNRCVKAHFSDWRAEMDLHEKKAKKDYDGDGKIESGEEEYKGSRDKAIKKAIAMREDWQKVNKGDKTDGMSQKAVNAYRRENPGSKLKTAVTGKVKKGSKDAKRRKSFCSRSDGQRKMHNIDCSKTPEKKICKARKRWKC